MEENILIDSGASKKHKLADSAENKGDDIISNLPEPIISQILSLLPTKEVLRTCVLSRDWEYKWTGIYIVDIDDDERFSLKKTKNPSVVDFVDRIFIFSRTATLKRFRFLCHQKYDPRRMMTWIAAALIRNVEDLEIVYNFEGVVLPRCILNCKTLKNLNLQMPCIFRPSQTWFSNLKNLYLTEVEILNKHAPATGTSRLIFDFPLLEMLALSNCKWLKVDFVEINVPSLTKFTVYYTVPEIENIQMRISGAKLVQVEASGTFLGMFDLSASTVSRASINFLSYSCLLQPHGMRKNGQNARLFLEGCKGLNDLHLLTDVMEIIDQSKEGPPLPQFDMIKRLEICTGRKIEALLEFLHATPYVECLTIHLYHCEDFDYDSFEPVPSCILSHLREVEFIDFEGLKPHVHVADFLFKNAVELKKMSGLFRKKREEEQAENNFWDKLKKAHDAGDVEVHFDKNYIQDIERRFGGTI